MRTPHRAEHGRDSDHYRGYGACTDCGGAIGRAREEGLTIDRCHKCGAEWQHAGRRRDWIKVE